jgi:hypothetical protein
VPNFGLVARGGAALAHALRGGRRRLAQGRAGLLHGPALWAGAASIVLLTS